MRGKEPWEDYEKVLPSIPSASVNASVNMTSSLIQNNTNTQANNSNNNNNNNNNSFHIHQLTNSNSNGIVGSHRSQKTNIIPTVDPSSAIITTTVVK